MNYIQLPILANLGLGNEYKGLKGFLLAGPQISYAIADHEARSSTWTTTTTNGQETPDRSNNVYAQYGKPLDHKIDYGITAGLGIELTTGIGHLLWTHAIIMVCPIFSATPRRILSHDQPMARSWLR